jgi:hypothetical protein
MLEVMKETNEMLPSLLQWESTGEALTFDTAKAFFEMFSNSTVNNDSSLIIFLNII